MMAAELPVLYWSGWLACAGRRRGSASPSPRAAGCSLPQPGEPRPALWAPEWPELLRQTAPVLWVWARRPAPAWGETAAAVERRAPHRPLGVPASAAVRPRLRLARYEPWRSRDREAGPAC